MLPARAMGAVARPAPRSRLVIGTSSIVYPAAALPEWRGPPGRS
jgi:NAD-dependent SIR2 family protein deacetylase